MKDNERDRGRRRLSWTELGATEIQEIKASVPTEPLPVSNAPTNTIGAKNPPEPNPPIPRKKVEPKTSD